MIYGDLQFIDIIVFAGIAAFLIYRLKNVLGKRGGFEKKIPRKETSNETKEVNNIENKKTTPQLKDNESEFSKVYDKISDFDHRNFLDGAKFAFETIINAFNKGDKTTLKKLLTKTTFLSFEKAIDEGANNPDFQFYSLVVDKVEKVSHQNDVINITLKFTSEQFKDTDETNIIKKEDTWTFQKKINSNSTIWLLSST
tara:strand:+ start:2567 stop:3160 length:594 start_codon:yes stop_codon:yes gene_type:complete